MDDRERLSAEEVFAEALERPRDARLRYVAEICAGDTELEREVESLLAAYESGKDVIRSPFAPGGTASLPGAGGEGTSAPARIGPYRVLETLGAGGMGEVYLVEQETPIRRQAALKLVKLGMDTRAVIARFESERQALALMDHPHIARVFDAGATDEGRPYFVMEYVRGAPITDYCDRHRLDTRERLVLFAQTCRAIHHAHQKAVIHRDIKPSNVMVTVVDGAPAAKVIDFGIAKAIGHRLTDKTVFTEHGLLVGTPEYMSPEQAEGVGPDVDTTTDVYSLGVLLYELLAGALPFDSAELRSHGYDGIRKTIREVEPPRPSTRLGALGERITDIAARRRTDPPGLRSELRGDLDWITMRAMEKNPTRRYQSASELAADIDRHLTDQPIMARPPSTAYALGKLISRHRGLFLSAATLLVLLVAFAITMSIMFDRQRRERLRADAARARAEMESRKKDEINAFLQGMLVSVDPEVSGSSEVTVREVLDAAAARIDEPPAPEPEIEADLRATIGRAYTALGHYDEAERHLRRALALRVDLLGDDDPAVAGVRGDLAVLLRQAGVYDEAGELFRRALRAQQASYGEEHPAVATTLNDLALLRRDQGEYAAADSLFRRSLAILRRLDGPAPSAEVAITLNNLAVLCMDDGRPDEAEALFREALAMNRALHGDEHASVVSNLENLAVLMHGQGRYAEAEPLSREALSMRRRLYGDEHPDVARGMNNLASILQNLGRTAEAESLFRESLAMHRRLLGDDHPEVAATACNLAGVLQDEGRHREAEPLYRECLRIRRQVLGDDHPNVGLTLNNLASLLRDIGEPRAAEQTYRDALRIWRASLGADHVLVSYAQLGLANVLMDQGRYADAEPYLAQCLAIRRDALAAADWRIALAENALAACLSGQRRLAEAGALFRRSHPILMRSPAVSAARRCEALARIAAFHEAAGHADSARAYRVERERLRHEE